MHGADLLPSSIPSTSTAVALVHDPDAEPQTADQPPPGGQEADGVSCLWWRRGRVELLLEHARDRRTCALSLN